MTPEQPGSEVGGGLGYPEYKPIVEPSMPLKGDEDNPVYTWHNNFLQVRLIAATVPAELGQQIFPVMFGHGALLLFDSLSIPLPR